MDKAVQSARRLRADAQRNREALVTAARELFDRRGPDVSMLEIAESAGVGNGTLYRHFPDRGSLIAAVYHDGLIDVCNEVNGLLAAHPGDEAIELWLRRMVQHVQSNRALKLIIMQLPTLIDWSPAEPVPSLFADTEVLLETTMSQLLDAASRQERIGYCREPRDLLRLASAICQIDAGPEEAARMIALLVDGLRYRQPHTA